MPRTGNPIGRPKGKASKANEEARRRAAESGMLPMDYMLEVLRSSTQKQEKLKNGKTRTFYVDMFGDEITSARRDAMAMAVAPYVHSRLSAITHKGDPANPVRHIHENMSPQEAAQAYAETIRGTPSNPQSSRPPLRLVSNQ